MQKKKQRNKNNPSHTRDTDDNCKQNVINVISDEVKIKYKMKGKWAPAAIFMNHKYIFVD